MAAAIGIPAATVYTIACYLRRIGADIPPAHSHEEEHVEDPAIAAARVARGVADGTRCPRCWLLRPCDHG